MPRSFHLVLFAVAILCESAASRSALQAAVQAKADLPAGLYGNFQTRNTDHFNVIYDPRQAGGEKIADALELAYGHFKSLFESRDFELRTPAEKLTWITFDDSACFNRYASETEGRDLSWLTGYYSAGTNAVAMITPQKLSRWQVKEQTRPAMDVIACPPEAQTDLVKLVHEVAHQLSFNTGLQKRKVLYPIWASEGLAMFFERSLLSEYSQSSAYRDVRGRQLVQLHRQGRLIRLEDFISASRLDEGSGATDVYAQAWGLFQFLCERRTEALRKYLSGLHELEPGYRDQRTLACEFVAAFGSLDQVDRQWQQFLEDLSARQ